jgi:hypothetical protein
MNLDEGFLRYLKVRLREYRCVAKGILAESAA